MPETKLYLVVRQDTILQATGYLVRAETPEMADKSVSRGLYIEETATTTLDTIDSETIDITEIHQTAKGQSR